ncbi:MAG: hypothetical protein ABSC55_26245, partial [Syntrophorhabdales bacterium]
CSSRNLHGDGPEGGRHGVEGPLMLGQKNTVIGARGGAKYRVELGRDQELGRSEALLRLQGEELIEAKAADVAAQLNLVLQSVPWMTLQDLRRDRKFHEVAVQRVGRTGYTTIYETRTGISRFHRDRKYENVNLRRFSKSLPAFWAIVRKSLKGKSASGYYDWREPDGSVRPKYMYAIPLRVRTGDGVRLTVAATAYVDEFTQAIREAKAIHQDTTRFLMNTIGMSIQAFRKTGQVVMGLGIVVASLLALCVGIYFSRTIGRLRNATSRVNAGDYAVRVRSSMSGEMGTLVLTSTLWLPSWKQRQCRSSVWKRAKKSSDRPMESCSGRSLSGRGRRGPWPPRQQGWQSPCGPLVKGS